MSEKITQQLFEAEKFAVFTYDFPHRKSSEGLLRLALAGVPPKIVFSAPRVELHARTPKYPNFISGGAPFHPKEIATALGLNYLERPHSECIPVARQQNIEIALVLGARILPQNLIDAFPGGVYNIHPGVLPSNRGLDTVKHAILQGMPLGVTLHRIGAKIDSGELIRLLYLRSVEPQDTIATLNFKVQSLELELISDLPFIPKAFDDLRRNPDGVLRTRATSQEEDLAQSQLAAYLGSYSRLIG